MNGSRTLKVDSDKAIKDILLSRGGDIKTVEVSICDFSNWIHYTINVPPCQIGDAMLVEKLKALNLKKCLRREASMYALFDLGTKNRTWWLCSI